MTTNKWGEAFIRDLRVVFSNLCLTLREKCSYSELFWSDFPTFGLNMKRYSLREKCPNTKFFLVRIFLYSDQKKLHIWTLFMQWLRVSNYFYGSTNCYITIKYIFSVRIFLKTKGTSSRSYDFDLECKQDWGTTLFWDQ